MTQISKAVVGARQAAIASLTDAELLSCFLEQRNDAPFAAMVQRHGPMVWSVCRRHLDHHQAEDALQAVFLVLFRRAASIKPRKMLANWLYGVAVQSSLHARRTIARRRKRERQVPMPEPAAKDETTQIELRAVLDAELNRLPNRYRAAVVLCDVEGQTRKQAARQLCCPEGTVAANVARGRAMLAKQLARRGVLISAGALAAMLSQNAFAVPPSIVSSTIATVVTQTISAKVALLAEGIVKAMLVTKFTKTLATVLLLGLVAIGATLAGTAGQAGRKPAAVEKPVEPAATHQKDQQPITAWGEEVGGLQAGLSIRPDRKVYHYGETVTLTIRVRNVSKATVKLSYLMPYIEHVPIVTNGDGKQVPQPTKLYEIGERLPGQVELQPGKEIEIHELKRELKPASDSGSNRPRLEGHPHALYATGKVGVQYEQVLGDPQMGYPGWKLDPPLSKLATGKLELQVLDAEDTAWGTEAGGLQAGLSISNRKDIQIGGKATAVVKLRNVSNKSIATSVWPLWLTGPRVVDSQGKQVRATRAPQPDFEIIPTKITLQPGQTVELAKSTIFVAGAEDEDQPVPGGVVDHFTVYVRPGPYKAMFAGFLQGLPTLATGETEFKVKDTVEPTAWGNEVGGLQAGLVLLPGQKRVYRHGETVTLAVNVRNIGKQIVKFQYLHVGDKRVNGFPELKQVLTEPLSVTNDKRKAIPQTPLLTEPFNGPRDVLIAPGEEHRLYELNLTLRPDTERDEQRPLTLYGTGSIRIQHQQALPMPTDLLPKPNLALSKLATGQLELQVREEDTAWGKPVGGLQAGLALQPKQLIYHDDDVITLNIRVRNVSKEKVKFEYLRQFLDENPPTVTNADNKAVRQLTLVVEGFHVPVKVSLAPGEEIQLQSRLQGAELKYVLNPTDGGPAGKASPLRVPMGKVTLQYKQVLGDSSSGQMNIDPVLSKLATGKVELQVQAAEKQEGTAWGKESGGLQAGLEIRPGKRVYHHGETVSLFVRVRNISKEAIKFEYVRQFLDENPPTVTDAAGKKVSQDRLAMLGEHIPLAVSLDPGKEIVLESRLNGASGLKYQLKPVLGTGKITIQYPRVLGSSSSGFIKLDPALNKLATGKLQLEIKPAAAEKEAWGKEVEGLLCRLQSDKKGDVPAFKLTVRDLGKRDLQMHMAEDGCEIEFDGTWFRWFGPVSIIGGSWPAGRRYDDFEIPVSLGPRWQDSLGKSIKLTPGKHTIRIAYVTLDRKMPVRAVSNPVEITVAPR